MTVDPTRSSAAARSRRYRQRKRDGVTRIILDLHADTLAGLNKHGLMPRACLVDGEAVAAVVSLLIYAASKGGLRLTPERLA